MNELGIERLGTFGMPPAEMAALAADLGADCIGIGLATSSTYNPDGFERYSLRDAVQRRETMAACRGSGVRISIVEGFAVLPENDMRAFAGDLDIVRELGCDRINVVSTCPGLERTIEGFHQLCEIAREREINVSAEMGSLGPLKQVDVAQEVARRVNQPNFSLVIDSMHFFRLDNSVADFAALDPALIGYIQLADAPWKPRFDTYLEEAMFERMVPGEGELPLAEFVPHIPTGVVVSVEVPIRSRAEAGLGVRERTAPCIAAAKALLRQVPGNR
jgi:sugar phosphate isomerase/epimerase